MNVCITAQADTLDAPVDPRFGRCRFFLFVDTASLKCEAVANAYAEGNGAGIQAGQFVAARRVTAVLTGKVGTNAQQTLQSAGICIVADQQGTAREALERFIRQAEAAEK